MAESVADAMSAEAWRDWHVQVCFGTWVRWWYGALPAGAQGHIARAETLVVVPMRDGSNHELRIPFKLPEHRSAEAIGTPQVHEHTERWGWRIRSNDKTSDTGWELADSQDAAVAAARKYAQEREPELLGALDDIREYCHGLW